MKIKKEVLIGILLVVVMVVVYFQFKDSEEEIFKSELSSLELAQNLEKYEGKEFTILNAYIPSEAFIYVNEENISERIFLNPPNRAYCRYYNLKGNLTLEEKGWTFNVEEYGECLGKK